ncbi:hypothetical protein HY604_03255 [Candidatus Peregrinibacteria bacterium]|nr:hypothetical protein [Candidatus Peregrinibacteria bacterium]
MKSVALDSLLKRKTAAKTAMAKELGFSKKKPLIGIFLDQEIDREELLKILEGLKFIEAQVVILADIHEDFNGAKTLKYERENRKSLLEACDIALIFDFSDVEEMLLHGVIPVSSQRPEVVDYNPNRETGNSFVYRCGGPWGIFAAVVRAIETFKFPYDWKHIVRQGITSVKP